MEILVPLLAFGTIGAVVAFGWLSQIKTDRRRHSNMPKSTLAADASDRTPPGQKPVDV